MIGKFQGIQRDQHSSQRQWPWDGSKMHNKPENNILTRDKYGSGGKKEWHYSSVIGQMSYLYGTTIPDIMFSVNQCAKYIIDPKQSF